MYCVDASDAYLRGSLADCPYSYYYYFNYRLDIIVFCKVPLGVDYKHLQAFHIPSYVYASLFGSSAFILV